MSQGTILRAKREMKFIQLKMNLTQKIKKLKKDKSFAQKLLHKF